MGDRVAWIGGKYPLEDCFPFPLEHDQDPVLSGFRTSLTPMNYFNIFWRVKSWTAPSATLSARNADTEELLDSESYLVTAEDWGRAYFSDGGSTFLSIILSFNNEYAQFAYSDDSGVTIIYGWVYTPFSINFHEELGAPAFNFDVTASEFWPYATQPTPLFPEGLSVYDTTTGAQLRDPFS